MTGSTSLHDIKTLIESLHPLLAIETVEERVRSLLETASAELDLPLFEWSVTSGLKRTDQPTAAHGTTSPLGLMKHLGTLKIAAIGSRNGRRRSSSWRPPTTSMRCRPRCCARAGSTRSSLSTCPMPTSARRS